MKNSSGFTLVELLIAIAIISIISVVILLVLGDVRQTTRNARRLADIREIASALENRKNDEGYQPLVATDFIGGIPQDPGKKPYCFASSNTTTPPASPGSIWPDGPGDTCSPPYSLINITTMFGGGTNQSWRVCAVLEGSSSILNCLSSQRR